ncbi:MAG: DMT family transporter [Cellvibrionaceae bacterium]|nr:DMT family transporter [Cellvibrionaceae bacterium]
MINGLAYIALVAIWSTTPLAIKWTTAELSFSASILWRILLSASLALAILKLRGEPLFPNRAAWRIYSIAALGIVANFLLVYWASTQISSGLISVIFSTAPLLIGIMVYCWIGHNPFTRQRLLALCLSMAGLLIVFYEQLHIGIAGIYGIIAMIASVIMFAFSSTWLQKIGNPLSTLHTTTGSLCFSVPPVLLCWWFLDGSLPLNISWQARLSILYLGVFGSLIGFFLYYLLLHRLSAPIVSTAGMISPVFALILGHQLADETLGPILLIGTGLVLAGLALYHGGRTNN